MDIYHGWCDLRPGVGDKVFADAFNRYMALLKDEGKIAGYRLTRRKLGLGPAHLGEFHFMIEVKIWPSSMRPSIWPRAGQSRSKGFTMASTRWCRM
ncbi:MAG: hypothetical protein PW790_08705 [Parvibaculaceae bacterium]|nr:hypothetical protein [Parvibaculaceae bacterium]